MIKNSKNTTFLLLCAGLAAGLGGCSTLEKHIPGIGSSATETSGSSVRVIAVRSSRQARARSEMRTVPSRESVRISENCVMRTPDVSIAAS